MQRVSKSDTHKEWEAHYEELLSSLRHLNTSSSTQNIEQRIQLKRALIEHRLKENHDDYCHQPDKLLVSLMQDVEKLCNHADEDYLFNQSIESRLFISKIRLTIRRIQDDLQQILETEKEKTFCQEQYDKLSAELAFYAAELHFSKIKTTYQALNQLLNKYYITMPIISNSLLTRKDFDYIQDIERTAYQTALSNLQATIAQLPSSWQAIKDDSHDLINKMESSRQKKQTRIESSRDTAFDYVRHTYNLKRTNELLKQPNNISIQNEYVALIHRNHKYSTPIKNAMEALIAGVILLTLGVTLLCFAPASIFIVGMLTALAGLYIGYQGIMTGKVECKRQQKKHTWELMSSLYNDVRRAPTKSAETMVSQSESEKLLSLRV